MAARRPEHCGAEILSEPKLAFAPFETHALLVAGRCTAPEGDGMDCSVSSGPSKDHDVDVCPVPPKGDPATRAFYEENASSYAAATRTADLSALMDGFARQLPAGARVLDLGSGSGRDLAGFLARGFEAVGLDLSINMADLARLHSGAPVAVADMVSLPFAEATFDAVWASASLLHLEVHAQIVALAEIRRVLRTPGLLFSSMKRGSGDVREPCGRAFSYVEADDWTDRLQSTGYEVLQIATQIEARPVSPVSWLSCLCRPL